MKGYKKQTLALVMLLAVVFSASVYAVVKDTATYATNRISTDDVHIELSEYEQKDTGESAYQNGKTVLPGETVSKISRIRNLAADCWVRAKVTFAGDVSFSGVRLQNIPSEWKRVGEYFYYTKPLEKKESVDLFRSIVIPAEVTEADAGKDFHIEVRVDAIQSFGVEPDFQGEDPWKGVEIQECIHSSEDIVYNEEKPVSFSVEYRDGSSGLVAEPDDFFQNFEKLLPGMKVSDQVTLRNLDQSTVELFFRTEHDSGDAKAAELLEAVTLKLLLGEKIIYEGNLKGENLKERISLGTFSKGDSAQLSYTLEMPAELKNEYARRAADVKWIFEAEAKEEDSDAQEHSSGGSGTNPVKTGDLTPIFLWSLLAVLSFGAILVLLGRKKRGGTR